MPPTSELMRRLDMAHPIIQAPLAGGGDTPALVSASCDAGAMGFVGAAYLTPPQIAESAQAVGARTDRPFGINLFAPQPAAETPGDAQPALARVAPYFEELGLPPPVAPTPVPDPFAAQFKAVLDSGAAVFSFTFGIPPADALAAAKERGMVLIGTATTVDEAKSVARAGVDAVVVQGSEAGGQRASFARDFETSAVGTMALVPQVVDAVDLPVIASGGIMDGRGIAAALALGADAVQMGTAFLTCDEAGIPDAHRAAILAAQEDETRLTRAFSGRPSRGIVNRFMDDLDRAADPDAILPFPLQNALTRPMRAAAAKAGKADYLSLWAGQGVRLARRQSAAELIARLAEETSEAIARMSR
ncbi:MAG: nitronate monooxygenase [Alphaproteobacteria bacterium]|nr:nitronate monooxygenase [Alphaproteobacteria bacterium]